MDTTPSTELVPVIGCPECAGALNTIGAEQGCLMIGAGYGMTERYEWSVCPACHWSLLTAVRSGNPRAWRE